MDSNLLTQAQNQYVYNNFADCAQTCDMILAQNPGNFDALHYKALSLLALSKVDFMRIQEGIKTGEVCKNVATNKMEVSDEFLKRFNREMDRICQELLMIIRASNNRERNTTCLSQTHDVMKCFEMAVASFPEASLRVRKETLVMCNKWISGLTGWAHDAAKIYNGNIPYNEGIKRLLAGGSVVNVAVPKGMKQSELGVAGFVCSFFPFLCFLGVVMAIVGIVVQFKTRRKGLAIAGIVIGMVMSCITMAIIGAL